MKMPALLLLLTAALAIAAEVPLGQHALEEVKGSVMIPEGWTSTKESEDGVFVYHFGKNENGSGPSITLSVTTKVADRTGQSPSEYAAALIEMSQEESPGSTVQKGDFQGLKSLRVEYDIESEAGQMHAVNVALANDRTGTLYFFAWQTPLGDSMELEALREKILASAEFDPEF